MRVLLVNDAPPGPTGGAEVYLDTIARSLEAAGDTVDVLAGEVIHQGWHKVLDVWDPAAARLVADRARRFAAEIVHHHNVARELSTSVLRATPERPTVLTLHDFRLLGRGDVPDAGLAGVAHRWIKRPLDRAVASRSVDMAVAVSEAVAVAARVAGYRCVEVLDQPVAGPDEEPPPASAGTSVLFVGRLSHDKGIGDLLDVARRLATSHPDVAVEVLGDGPLIDVVHDEAATLSNLRVHGRGDRAAVEAAYGRARVVVVPSRPARRPEGGSLVAIEAARHGRPVVVGADPAVRSVVAPLGHADVTDGSPAALHGAVGRLLDDPALADRLGGQGAATAVRHEPVVVARRLQELHDRARALHAGRRRSS